MTLLINNESQAQLLNEDIVIDVLEDAFREEAKGAAVNRNKAVFHVPHSTKDFWYNYVSMEGAIQRFGVVAVRIRSDVNDRRTVFLNGAARNLKGKFAGEPGKYCGLVLLFSSVTGELLAILNDGYIQHLRVAATSAISAKYMSREDSTVLGILGSGGMARSHALALT